MAPLQAEVCYRGMIARLMYHRCINALDDAARVFTVFLQTLARIITRRTEAQVKLH